MKKPFVVVLILGVVISALFFFRSYQQSNSGATTAVSTVMPSVSSVPSGAVPTGPVPSSTVTSTASVAISNFTFTPSTVTVKAGTKVTWKNTDSVVHSVIADGGTFSSPILRTGDAFEFIFSKVGIYNYHCGIHPSMKAKIVVQ